MAQSATGPTEYARLIEAVAEEFRSGFESGEFRGFSDADDEPFSRDPRFVAPWMRLERAVAIRVLGVEPRPGAWDEATIRRACWALLHSPSTGAAFRLNTGAGMTVEAYACEAAALDVLRVARARGWYRATPDEVPSNKDLGLAA